jgi:Gpi18-like mannosyltransferase
VTLPADRPRDVAGPLLLGALVLLAVAVRVPSLQLTGHLGDVLVVSDWAERLAANGTLTFYRDGGGSIYPALLYLYWPLGVLFDGERLSLAIKALAIPFDVAVGVLLYAMTSRPAGWAAGLGAAALYLLNPAVILAGPVWGQIDAAGTLAMLAALWAAARGRPALAAALAVVAGMVKPQFGLVLIAVLTIAVIEWRRSRSAESLLWALAGAAAGYFVIAAPLLLDPITHAMNISNVTTIRTEASVHAPNMWALAFGYERADTGFGGIGLALMAAGLGLSLLPLRHGRHDLRTMLVVGTFVVFAFYFLPTRVHERYLFPAMAVLAPLAAVSRPVLLGYLALAAGFTLSLLYALADTTPFEMPADWEQVLLSPWMVPVLSLLMLAAAVTLVVQLATGAGAPLRETEPRASS